VIHRKLTITKTKIDTMTKCFSFSNPTATKNVFQVPIIIRTVPGIIGLAGSQPPRIL